MIYKLPNSTGGYAEVVMPEAKETTAGIVLKNIMVTEDPLNNKTMTKEQIEQMGITLTVQKVIPERVNPLASHLIAPELILYTALLNKNMTYLPSKTNPKYYRNILLNNQIIASLFVKAGQAISILDERE